MPLTDPASSTMAATSPHLVRILDQKQTDIHHLYATIGLQALSDSVSKQPPRKSCFLSALATPKKLHLIAEVKKASPSKGLIRTDFNPLNIALDFEKQGASCLSVLTETHFFLGSPDYLKQIKQHTTLPLLRKDFILDPIQVYETADMQADAMLLILAILSPIHAQELLTLANQLGLDVLVEIHNSEEMAIALTLEGRFAIGINNRNLHTFEVNLNTTLTLAKDIRKIAPSKILVAESGYATHPDLAPLYSLVNAVLIGEGLAKNPTLTVTIQGLQ